MGKEHNISSKQAMILILASQVGTGILSLPAQLAKNTGHDGWISVVLSGIVSMLATVIIVLLLLRYSNKSIFNIMELLYGRFLGKVFSLIIILYLLIISILTFRIFIVVVRITVLRLTNPVVLSFFAIIPTVYLTWYGLKAVCKYSYMIIIIMGGIIILCLSVSNNFTISYMQPIAAEGVKPILNSMTTAIYSFLGFEIVAIIYPYITDKKNTMKYSVLATTVTMLFFTFIVVITTGVFGENMLKHLVFPLYNLSRIFKFSFVDRLDLFFIILWLPAMAGTSRIYLASSYYSFCNMFNIKNKPVTLTIYTIMIILIGRIPKNLNELYKYSGYVSIAGLSLISFLLISYIFSFINRRGVKV